jgi:acetyl-CoA decarbonylase/synthase complex subunit gamma
MRRVLELLGELSLVGLGVAGTIGVAPMPTAAAVAFLSLGGVLLALHLLSVTFVKAGQIWPSHGTSPLPLRIGLVDYAKALVAWVLSFRRTYAVAPGLYYTGDHYDPEAPLLVTANYHLTVFLVTRRVRAANARLLVIDTDGINVWCAAGKGRFGNHEITRQLDRYPRDLLSTRPRLRLILPKFGMSGVDLRALRQQGLRPIVGPLYAKDLPAYLASPPLKNRQLTALSALLAAAVSLLALPLGAPVQLGMIGVIAALATAYPLLFPLIPGRRFAVKGLLLGLLASAVLLAVSWIRDESLLSVLFVVPFTLAAGILIGLEFTGNSAVSNYSRVKREIVVFLPIGALLLLFSTGAFFMVEVLN